MPESTHPQFGELLNIQLLKADRTPSWLARRLGIQPSTVTRWLNEGGRPGSPEMVIRIADVLGASNDRHNLLVAAGYGYLDGAQEETTTPQLQPSIVLSKSPSVPNNLPQAITRFVGRKPELEQLARHLADPDCRLLTLIGPGGIGKTRLAIEAARQIDFSQSSFSDGIYFVSMAEHDSPEQLSYAMVEALGLTVADGQEIQSRLIDFLQDKRLLFVLDNFEHRLDAAERVERILRATPNVKILVTSRERLHSPGEQLFHVHGLEYERLAGQSVDEELTAAQLFLQSARLIDYDLRITPEGKATIIEICRQVEGMPLAIELAASWIEVLYPAQILAEIQRGLDILTADQHGKQDEHANMRAVFERTWRRLDAAEQQAFARLAVFRAPFTREAAEAVAGATLPLLSRLAGKSLIQYRREQGRYAFHALIHQFALEKLRETEGNDFETHKRLCAYYADFIQRQMSRIQGRESSEAVAYIDAEIDNIRVVWRWALAHKQLDVIEISLIPLMMFFNTTAFKQETQLFYTQGAEVLEMSLPEGREGVLLATLISLKVSVLTNTVFDLGEVKGSASPLDLLQRSISIFEQTGELSLLATALKQLVFALFITGDFQRAIQYGLQALAIYSDNVESGDMLALVGAVGSSYAALAEYTKAIHYFEWTIRVAESTGDRVAYGANLATLADSLRACGHYEEARKYAQKAVEVNREIGNVADLGTSLHVLGETELNVGDFAAALLHGKEELTLYQAGNSSRLWDGPGVLMGNAACGMGELDEAKGYFAKSLDFHLAHDLLDGAWWAADAALGLAMVLVKEGKFALALELCDFVLQHRSVWQESKTQANQLITELMATVPDLAMPPRRSGREVISEALGKPLLSKRL